MKKGMLAEIMKIKVPSRSSKLRSGLRPSDSDPDPDDDGDDDRFPDSDTDSDDDSGLEYGPDDDASDDTSDPESGPEPEDHGDDSSEHERMIAEDLVSALGIRGADIGRVCEALRAMMDLTRSDGGSRPDDDTEEDPRDSGY